jgi:hypothetical protein
MSRTRGRPKKDPYMRQRIYNVRLPIPVYVEFKLRCKEKGTTVSSQIKSWILEFIQNEKEVKE